MRARRLSYVPEAYSYPSYGAADTENRALSLDEQIRSGSTTLGHRLRDWRIDFVISVSAPRQKKPKP
jgi:hypothetical protein